MYLTKDQISDRYTSPLVLNKMTPGIFQYHTTIHLLANVYLL